MQKNKLKVKHRKYHKGLSIPYLLIITILIFLIWSCKDTTKTEITQSAPIPTPKLTFAEANRLAALPLACLQIEYPNKLGQTLADASHIDSPKNLHPAFYGCFDWHSAVHAHWSLVALLKQFPTLNQAATIRQKLTENISKANIAVEIAYFNRKGSASFERTYGWAWILKLAEELHTWNDPMARELEKNLQPLTDYIEQAYIEFLPKLNYPIRVGEHSNTAFALSMALDYAQICKRKTLEAKVKKAAIRFYALDTSCPLNWEPSGFDFLSPCLEEANLMRKIYEPKVFRNWLNNFLPQLGTNDFVLEPGKVSDRSDGKLVHLDGLNFSRAWCLYNIASILPEYQHLKNNANQHISVSLPNLTDTHYSGSHWLGTFALYALNTAK